MFGWPSLSNVFCCVQQGLGPQTLVCVYKLVIVHPCDCDASLMASWRKCTLTFSNSRCASSMLDSLFTQTLRPLNRWSDCFAIVDAKFCRWLTALLGDTCTLRGGAWLGQVACCWFKVGPCIECIDDIHIDVYLYAHICTIYVCM